MGKQTGISWTDHTFNPWWGCEKALIQIGGKTCVSPECEGCYAEVWDARCGGGHWGRTAPRRFFGDKHWNEPLAWNREAEKDGVRRRVFCLSMGDICEDRRDLDAHRERLWPIIEQTKWLDWLLLTKHPDLFEALIPAHVWQLPNIHPGITAGVQDSANLRAGYLVRLKAKYPHIITWVSAEPLLSALDLWPWIEDINWVIVGGQSGAKAKPMHPDWARSVRDQCLAARVPFFFKQWGEFCDWDQLPEDVVREIDAVGEVPREMPFRVGKKAAGHLLDGQVWQQAPWEATR